MTHFILKHQMYLLTLAITYCLQSTDVCHQQAEWYDHAEASSIE